MFNKIFLALCLLSITASAAAVTVDVGDTPPGDYDLVPLPLNFTENEVKAPTAVKPVEPPAVEPDKSVTGDALPASFKWSALPGSIRSVAVTTTEIGLFRGSQGAVGMPEWSGATLGNGSMWLWGGGHGNYGGNEVYQYDLTAKTWRRYGPWLEYTKDKQGCLDVVGAPMSAHSASGLWWAHGELWISGYSGFCKGGGSQQGFTPNVWSFNPATEKWTVRGNLPMGEPHIAYDAEKDLVYLWSKRSRLDVYNGSTLELVQHLSGPLDYVADYTHLLLDNVVGKLYGISKGKLYIWSINTDGTIAKTPKVINDMPHAGQGYALRDGKLYIWSGKSNVIEFDRDKRTSKVIQGEGGPARKYSRIFSKWQYDAEQDRFLGFSSFDSIYQWAASSGNESADVVEPDSKPPVAVVKPEPDSSEQPKPLEVTDWYLDPISYGGLVYFDPNADKPTKPSLTSPTGGMAKRMAATGDRSEIGLVTAHQAALLSGDESYRDSVMYQASDAVAKNLNWDASHTYPLYWVPYLMTGDEQYLDKMRGYWKKYQEFRGRKFDGPIEALTARQYAWQLRNLARLAKVDETYRPMLEKTRLLTIEKYIETGKPGRKVLHNIGEERKGNPRPYTRLGIATWQQAFVTQAIAHVVLLGFDEWRPVLNHNIALWRQFVEKKLKHIDIGDIYYWSKAEGDLTTWEDIMDKVEHNDSLRNQPDNKLFDSGVRHIRGQQALNAIAMAAVAGADGAKEIHAIAEPKIRARGLRIRKPLNIRDWVLVP